MPRSSRSPDRRRRSSRSPDRGRRSSYSRSPSRFSSRSPSRRPRSFSRSPSRRRHSRSPDRRRRPLFSRSPDRRRRRPSYSRSPEDRRRRSISRSRSPDRRRRRSADRRPGRRPRYEWGGEQPEKDERRKPPAKVEKEQPNFGLSGKLAQETNTVKGVELKYNEPPEAAKPRQKWRLYVFKGSEQIDLLHIHRQSAYLIGRDRTVWTTMWKEKREALISFVAGCRDPGRPSIVLQATCRVAV